MISRTLRRSKRASANCCSSKALYSRHFALRRAIPERRYRRRRLSPRSTRPNRGVRSKGLCANVDRPSLRNLAFVGLKPGPIFLLVEELLQGGRAPPLAVDDLSLKLLGGEIVERLGLA